MDWINYTMVVMMSIAIALILVGRVLVWLAERLGSNERLQWLGSQVMPLAMLGLVAATILLGLVHWVIYPINTILYLANPSSEVSTLQINGAAHTVPDKTEKQIVLRGWSQSHTITLAGSEPTTIKPGLYLTNLSDEHLVDYLFFPLYDPNDVREAGMARVRYNIANKWRSTWRDGARGERGVYFVTTDPNARVAAFIPKHEVLHKAGSGDSDDGIYWLHYR